MANTIIKCIIASVIAERGGGFALNDSNNSFRNKRSAIIFPPSSVLQLTMGVSAVLDLVGNASGQMIYAFQFNAPLPTNYTQLLLPPPVKVKRSLHVQHLLRHLFHRSAMNATECLAKVKCQLSQAPLHGGLLEEIINFAFTSYEVIDLRSERQSFLALESYKGHSCDCYSAFPHCKYTPLDLISQFSNYIF